MKLNKNKKTATENIVAYIFAAESLAVVAHILALLLELLFESGVLVADVLEHFGELLFFVRDFQRLWCESGF